MWKISEIPLLWLDEIPTGIISFEIIKHGITPFPVPYIGPIVLYVVLPLIYFFGFSIISLRAPFVILGILTIILTYYFAETFYNKKVAILAAFILSIFPAHIYFSRTVFQFIIVTLFVLLAIIFLNEFSRKRRKRYLYIFSLVCGLGVATRPSFLLYLLPLFILSILTIKFFKIKAGIKLYDLLICFLLFSVNVLPLIFNAVSNLDNIIFLFKDFPKTTEGVDLTDVNTNLIRGLSETFPEFLKGNFYYISFNSIFYYVFLVCMAIILIKIILSFKFGQDQNIKNDIFLLVIIFSTSILISILALSNFRHGDYLMLSPFYAIISSRALIELFKILNRFKIIFYPMILIISFLFFYEIYSFSIYFFFSQQRAEKIDPNSKLFDGICVILVDKVVDSISKLNHSNIFVDDCNLLPFELRWYAHEKTSKMNIDFMLECIGNRQLTIAHRTMKLSKALNDKDNLYILTSDNCLRSGLISKLYQEFDPRVLFFDVLKQYNKTFIVETTVRSPSGHAAYEIYRVV